VCAVSSGSRPLEFSWMKDGKSITSSTIEFSQTKSSSTIEINPIKSEDAGDYKCIVKNAVGSVFHSAKLVIEGELVDNELLTTTYSIHRTSILREGTKRHQRKGRKRYPTRMYCEGTASTNSCLEEKRLVKLIETVAKTTHN